MCDFKACFKTSWHIATKNFKRMVLYMILAWCEQHFHKNHTWHLWAKVVLSKSVLRQTNLKVNFVCSIVLRVLKPFTLFNECGPEWNFDYDLLWTLILIVLIKGIFLKKQYINGFIILLILVLLFVNNHESKFSKYFLSNWAAFLISSKDTHACWMFEKNPQNLPKYLFVGDYYLIFTSGLKCTYITSNFFA